MNTTKGVFKPKNPHKYKGDPTNIIYRSSWELKFMLYCDAHPDILLWSSEEIVIPYLSPIDGRWHRYFPDFLLKKRTKDKKVETDLIEIKPYAQTQAPQRKNKADRVYLNEVYTWGVNTSKWNAAYRYCLERGWKFIIMTEKKSYIYDKPIIL